MLKIPQRKSLPKRIKETMDERKRRNKEYEKNSYDKKRGDYVFERTPWLEEAKEMLINRKENYDESGAKRKRNKDCIR